MRPNLKSLVAASALVAGLVAAPALYAQDEPAASQPPMMGQGMMGQGGMMQGGQGGMMTMMGQMSEMMSTCNEMMKGMMANRGSQRPNEQWQDREPGQQENRG